jgi:hypothetical protein
MNAKSKGEKGQRIVIGELAKFDIDIAIPLSDNLPFDLIVVFPNKLFKVQVKTSSYSTNPGSICFGLSSNNWHAKTTKKYTEDDCDVMICCDLENVYLLLPEHFANRKAFSIRKTESKNKQNKGINFHKDFVLSEKRIEDVFGVKLNSEQTE